MVSSGHPGRKGPPSDSDVCPSSGGGLGRLSASVRDTMPIPASSITMQEDSGSAAMIRGDRKSNDGGGGGGGGFGREAAGLEDEVSSEASGVAREIALAREGAALAR